MKNLQDKLFIPENYLGFDHVNEINDISLSLFQNSPIHFFDFARIHYDGSWSYFTSNDKLSHFLFESGCVYLPNVTIDQQFNFQLLSTNPKFEQYLADLQINFDVSNILSCMIKHINYIEIYWFGAHEHHHCAANFFLNNLDRIKNSILSFNEMAVDLINLADKHRIIIPPSLKDDYEDAFKRIKLLGNSYFIYLNGIKVEFPKRQYECLNLIAQGCTAKMIAKELSLSIRTVECYLNTIKNKLSCHSRSELIKLLMKRCSY